MPFDTYFYIFGAKKIAPKDIDINIIPPPLSFCQAFVKHFFDIFTKNFYFYEKKEEAEIFFDFPLSAYKI